MFFLKMILAIILLSCMSWKILVSKFSIKKLQTNHIAGVFQFSKFSSSLTTSLVGVIFCLIVSCNEVRIQMSHFLLYISMPKLALAFLSVLQIWVPWKLNVCLILNYVKRFHRCLSFDRVHTSVYIFRWITENQQVHCIHYHLLKRP